MLMNDGFRYKIEFLFLYLLILYHLAYKYTFIKNKYSIYNTNVPFH